MGNGRRAAPGWTHELDVCSAGSVLVAGVDEAGRGAWAGPLVAAAVILPHPRELQERTGAEGAPLVNELARVRDSKLLSPKVREELLEAVRRISLAMGVGVVSPAVVDAVGVGPANRLAMARAVRDLPVQPDYLLTDAFRIHTMPLPQRPIIRGDSTCMSIAAASIVAKVTRDHIMEMEDGAYPGYGFAQHKGYGTRQHAESLLALGVTPIHRRCFAPVRAMLEGTFVLEDAVEDAAEAEDVEETVGAVAARQEERELCTTATSKPGRRRRK